MVKRKLANLKLTENDAVLCACYAAEMVSYGQKVGAKKHHGGTSSRRFGTIFGDTVMGQMAELSLSRHFGRKFEPPVLGDYESADLEGLCEVKASDNPFSGLLIYDSQDHDEKLMTHVRFSGFTAQFMGWIFGKEAKENRIWKKDYDTPCWRLDTKYLHPIETMPMDGRRFVKERR